MSDNCVYKPPRWCLLQNIPVSERNAAHWRTGHHHKGALRDDPDKQTQIQCEVHMPHSTSCPPFTSPLGFVTRKAAVHSVQLTLCLAACSASFHPGSCFCFSTFVLPGCLWVTHFLFLSHWLCTTSLSAPLC